MLSFVFDSPLKDLSCFFLLVFSHWLQDYLLSLISSQLKEFTDRYTFRHLQEPSAEIHMYTRNKTTNGF